MKLTKRQKKWIGYSAGGLLLLLASAFIWIGLMVQAASRRPPSSVIVVTQVLDSERLPGIKIKRADSYSRTVIHTGTVLTRSHTLVAFPRAGMVNELLFEEGQRVEVNQDMAVLDSRHLVAQGESLAAKLQQAKSVLAELQKGPRQESIDAAKNVVADLKAQLDAQQLRLERSEALLGSRSIARQDYERELYAMQGLKARQAVAQSQLDELLAGTRSEQIDAQQSLIRSVEGEQQRVQYNLDDCRLQAPFGGIIVSRYIDPGTVVTAGTPVFELIDDKNLEIHVGVPQSLAHQLQPGANYDVVAGETRLRATLRAVLPRIDASTRTNKAILDVTLKPDKPSGLFAGQLAKVELTQQVDDSGYWIPRLALTADHSGLWGCYVVEGETEGDLHKGKAVKQSVEILHMRDEWVFVRGTLRDGQILISDGMHRVVPGQTVYVTLTEPNTETSGLSSVPFKQASAK